MKLNLKFLSFIAILLITVLEISSCQSNSNASQQPVGGKLTVNDFEKRLNATDNAQVIDVRTPGEYTEGHLKNAANIDWNGGNFLIEISKLDKNKPIFVYCLSGGRSGRAAAKMQELGFKEVYDLQGGMMAWNNAGKPVSKDANSPSSLGMSMNDYSKKTNSNKLVLVDFNAPWCAPCKIMAPMFEEVAIEQEAKLDLLKINADENKALTKALQIDNLPTIFLYKNGKLVWQHVGLLEKADLLNAINSN